MWTKILCGGIAGGCFTLMARFVWDRYLAKGSRVTVSECEMIRKSYDKQLEAGHAMFVDLSAQISLLTFTMYEMCKADGTVDCSKLEKALVKRGVIK